MPLIRKGLFPFWKDARINVKIFKGANDIDATEIGNGE